VAPLLREYDLGALIGTTPLSGGSTEVLRVQTERGCFVLKPAYCRPDVELQARTAGYLSDRGFRQALVIPTRSGSVVSDTGHFLQQFLPGNVALTPTERQISAAMRYIGAYHRELADLPGPSTPVANLPGPSTPVANLPGPSTPVANLPGPSTPLADSVWQRVADPGYLVRTLPALLARHGLGGRDELAALDALERARPRLAELPAQLVHGDIGPDNVLMDGDEVVSIIDFTPHFESALLAAGTALYWYHVYGQLAVDADRLRQSVAELGAQRPWTAEELALWPAALLREALRRLATPLVLAAEADAEPAPSLGRRHAALRAVIGALDSL
jgi:Ser/Thr protein kinase RdoA (MazF antagonist)